jgi:hypothetical protein
MNTKLSKSSCLIVLVAVVAAIASAAVHAAEWGSLKGRFVVDGSAPTPPPLPVAASNDAFCIALKPANKSILLGDGKGLANALVFLRPARNEKVEVHSDYAAALEKPAVLDNKNCEFVPRITLVRVGQPLVIKNSDTTGHNTNADMQQNGKFNDLIAAGEQRERALTKAEALPAPVKCNIHAFMEGYLLVQDHPYMATTGDDGTFEIKNIPAGRREFQFWHERGYLRDLKFAGGTTNNRGRGTITIKAGETLDLGEIKVSAALLR